MVVDLKEYERRKFELAEQLRILEALAGDRRESIQGDLRSLFARIAEDRFNLVVVGRFSRGKTSLMNALLGTNRLPTGILPLTSVVTTVVYGSTERVVLKFEGVSLDSEIPLDALPHYITQQHNPGNVRRVETAEVQLPQELLRRGFGFIDTPGLGSHIVENSRTTQRFLPQADAFVLVTSYESPISEEELAVMSGASTSFRRVFVVLNKQDTVGHADRENVHRYVVEYLHRVFGPNNCPMLFSVSARDGLDAKLSSDGARLQASGIPLLEQALTAFMLDQKRLVFLLGMCERIIDLAAGLPATEELGEFIQTAELKGDEIRRADERPRSPGRPPGYAHPLDVQRDSCQICRLIQTATFERLAEYQHELATKARAQREHAENGGFCRMHTRQYAALASPHDVCVGSAALIEWLSSRPTELAETVDGIAERNSTPVCLSVTREKCPLCLSAAAAEMQAVSTLIRDWVTDGEAAGRQTSLICLPHVIRLLSALREEGLARGFLEREAAMLDRLAEDMRRYATKHDAVRRYLASQEEQDAAETALVVLGGLPNGHVSGT
jgi:GTP-binding protein EngB required for normal cell division